MLYALVKESSGWVRMLISYETKERVGPKLVLSGCKYVYGFDDEKPKFKVNEKGQILDAEKKPMMFAKKDLFEAENDHLAEDIFIKELVSYILESNKGYEKEQEAFRAEMTILDAKRKEKEKTLKERWQASLSKQVDPPKRKRGRPPKKTEN